MGRRPIGEKRRDQSGCADSINGKMTDIWGKDSNRNSRQINAEQNETENTFTARVTQDLVLG